MKTFILEAKEDDMTGVIGLVIKGLPNNGETNSASEGLLIAHDLIEHVNGIREIGSIDDELEALGGIWYVRGKWGQIRQDGSGMFSPEESIASDVTRMFRDFIYGSYVNLGFNKGKRAVIEDDGLKGIISFSEKKWEGEFNPEEDDLDDTEKKFKEYAKIALQRMRVGYTKARRKYERYGRWYANNLFWKISEAVERYCKHIDEGQQFKLSFDCNGAKCEEIFEEGY